jgi:hypothetical protein
MFQEETWRCIMGKKRSGKRMSATAKVIDFFSATRPTKKNSSKYTQVKPIKKLSDKDMKASQKFINESWERD